MRVAGRHDLVVHLVSNQWLRLQVGPKVNKVVVPGDWDAADNWIADEITDRDICITSDIPLASRCVEKGAATLGPTGKPFTSENIGMALAMRELKAHLRETGEGGHYNAGFTKQDRSRFLEALEQAVRDAKQ